jgi:hypothetical protein
VEFFVFLLDVLIQHEERLDLLQQIPGDDRFHQPRLRAFLLPIAVCR